MLIVATLFACTLIAMLINYLGLYCEDRTHRSSPSIITREGKFNSLYIYGCFVNQGTNPLLLHEVFVNLRVFPPHTYFSYFSSLH